MERSQERYTLAFIQDTPRSVVCVVPSESDENPLPFSHREWLPAARVEFFEVVRHSESYLNKHLIRPNKCLEDRGIEICDDLKCSSKFTLNPLDGNCFIFLIKSGIASASSHFSRGLKLFPFSFRFIVRNYFFGFFSIILASGERVP